VGLAGTAVRFNNDISYQSPVLGGFTVHAAYAAGEAPPNAAGVRDNKQGDTLGIAGVGAFGPVNFGVGFHSIDQGATPGIDRRTEAAVSVGAKFGNFGVGIAGAQTDNGAVNNNKRKAIFGSLSAGLGAGTVYLTFLKDDQGLNNQDNKGLGLTYSHGLSKRTFLYASLGLNTIDGATNAQDTKPKSLALGVRHFF
ncbi:MAG: porin, partial [Lautropia sp.]